MQKLYFESIILFELILTEHEIGIRETSNYIRCQGSIPERKKHPAHVSECSHGLSDAKFKDQLRETNPTSCFLIGQSERGNDNCGL